MLSIIAGYFMAAGVSHLKSQDKIEIWDAGFPRALIHDRASRRISPKLYQQYNDKQKNLWYNESAN